MAKATIARAVRSGRLHEAFPSVLSVVPPSLMTVEAWHAAAVLAGDEGACLCAASGAWWAGLRPRRPREIHVAVNSALKEVAGVRWHRLRLTAADRAIHRGVPITAFARIPLDIAADLSLWELKGVLAELEFHHDVHPADVAVHLRRGYPGSAKLRRALAEHTPELALTRKGLERAFAAFLVDRGFPLPRFNHPVGKSTVDAIYADAGVVIELDGIKGHSGERRILRDHRRDLHRRADGLIPLRYHYTQLRNPADQALIEAELHRFGVRRNRVGLVPPLGNRVGLVP